MSGVWRVLGRAVWPLRRYRARVRVHCCDYVCGVLTTCAHVSAGVYVVCTWFESAVVFWFYKYTVGLKQQQNACASVGVFVYGKRGGCALHQYSCGSMFVVHVRVCVCD